MNLTISCDVYIESNRGGAFIAGRVDKGGIYIGGAKGVFYWVFPDSTYKVTNDLREYLTFDIHAAITKLQLVAIIPCTAVWYTIKLIGLC